jgi:FAD synthase
MQHIIIGRVVKGDGYGRKLGFPTMNLETEEKKFPPEGVYCGTAVLEGKKYRAGIVIGPGKKIEAHLLGYTGDAYGREVALEINTFLREFKKFDTEEKLIAQIAADLKICSQA